MKRRDILKNIGLGSAGALIAGNSDAQTAKPKTAPIPEVVNGVLRHEIIRDNELKSKRFFTVAEMATIKILVDIIIPADGTSGSASQAGVPDFIEFISKDMPQHQTPLRGGLMWLDSISKRLYGSKFTTLSSANRFKIVDLVAYPKIAKPEHSQGVSFFNLMRNLTATGFFTSKMGMEDLGYKGNIPNNWDGVPQAVLDKYNLSYAEWEKHL